MYSSLQVIAQWSVAIYFLAVSFFPIGTRGVMMAAGARNFSPWSEYLVGWLRRFAHSAIFVAVLYIGGFWK
jgi:hypothetical protein